jgi:CxxC-x17-CxxC domain-containing protein
MAFFKKSGGKKNFKGKGGGNKFEKSYFGKKTFVEKESEDRDFNRGSGKFTLYKATCDDCDEPCEVPFKPSAGKPVFCSKCYKKPGGKPGNGKSGNYSGNRNTDQFKDQFAALDAKLDKILKLLASENLKD